MADIPQAIFQSIETIVDTLTETLKYDTMIVGVVKDLVDKDNGEYLIEYEGNLITAYSQDPINQVFENNEAVYVRIPEGDFSKPKNIERKSSSKSQIHNPFEYREVDNKTIYKKEANIKVDATAGEAVLFSQPIEISNKTRHLRLTADFKFEELKDEKGRNITYTTKGNYGITLWFKDKEGKSHTCSLDMNNFVGQPFGFFDWSPQYVDFTLPQDSIEILEKCVLFYEKFDNTQKLGQNIKVKNVRLTTYEAVNLSEIENYFTLSYDTIPSGYRLKADLKSYGRSMLSDSNSKITWYKVERDEEEKLTLQKLTSIWNDKCEVVEPHLYMVNVEYKDSVYQEYLPVGYKDEKFITQRSENGEVYLETQEKVSWYFKGKLIATDTKNIKITDYDLGIFNLFICWSKSNEEFYYYKIDNSSAKLDVSFKGADSFLYDENGILSSRDSTKTYTLQPSIVWPDGYASTYMVNWKIGDVSVSKTAIHPENSMIADIWTDNKILYFKVKNNYNTFYSNNKITAIIRITDNLNYTYEKEINFSKQGSQNLNSPHLQLEVEPLDLILGKTIDLSTKAKAYKNGQQVNANISYELKPNGDLFKIENNILSCLINSMFDISSICKITATLNNETVVYNAPINLFLREIREYNIAQYISYDLNRANPKYDGIENFCQGCVLSLTDNNVSFENNNCVLKPVTTIESITYPNIQAKIDGQLQAVFPIVIEIENATSNYDNSPISVNDNTTVVGAQAGDYNKATGDGILLGYNETSKQYEINAFNNKHSTFCLDSSGQVSIKQIEGNEHHIEADYLLGNSIYTTDGLRFRVKEWDENKEEYYYSSPTSLITDSNNNFLISSDNVIFINSDNAIFINSQKNISVNSQDSIILESSANNIRLSTSKEGRIYLTIQDGAEDIGGFYIYFKPRYTDKDGNNIPDTVWFNNIDGVAIDSNCFALKGHTHGSII